MVNKSLYFILSLDDKDTFGRDSGLAIVPAPRSLPRLIEVPREILPTGDNFVFLSSVIHVYVEELFLGMSVTECHQFRVTRNSDPEVPNVGVVDFAMELKGKLHSRRFGTAPKLEVGSECPSQLTNFLLDRFDLTQKELFALHGPVNLKRLMALVGMVDRPELRFPIFTPDLPKVLEEHQSIFAAAARIVAYALLATPKVLVPRVQ